jgi:hypothetical protein
MSWGITGIIIPKPMTSIKSVIKIKPIAALRLVAIKVGYGAKMMIVSNYANT